MIASSLLTVNSASATIPFGIGRRPGRLPEIMAICDPVRLGSLTHLTSASLCRSSAIRTATHSARPSDWWDLLRAHRMGQQDASRSTSCWPRSSVHGRRNASTSCSKSLNAPRSGVDPGRSLPGPSANLSKARRCVVAPARTDSPSWRWAINACSARMEFPETITCRATMSEVESAASILWWFPYVSLAISAWCLTAGVACAYRAVWLRRNRDRPVSDPVIAKALASAKPPPYFRFAIGWLALGLCQAAVTFHIW